MPVHTLQKILERHRPFVQLQGAGRQDTLCLGCQSPNGTLTTPWPCDAVTATQIAMTALGHGTRQGNWDKLQ